MTSIPSLKNLWLAALNLFYPHCCSACKKSLHYNDPAHLCNECFIAVTPVPDPICARCGVFLPDGGMHCYRCRQTKNAFSYVRSAGVFENTLRELIYQFKYKGKDYLAGELAQFLLTAWNRYPELHEAELVIPVPLHSSRTRERGFDQALLLAQAFIAFNNNNAPKKLYLADQILVRQRKTSSQTRLSREERMENMRSVFHVLDPSPILSKQILLIDDVCTTGATLNECAKALKQAGAKKIFCLTLARD